jgi:hypothetical protein
MEIIFESESEQEKEFEFQGETIINKGSVTIYKIQESV